MSENRRRRPVINAETVIINAEEVIVIEANDRRRHRKESFGDVAGVQDENRHRKSELLGDQDERRRRFPF
ncbi:hypothetical protein [Litchfieldia salsa]|uniref:Uncharacterized protein n=1 Tax=Litchfieldia salsa TaxID=930152 RepID=A0A1H0T9V0_9BACI|nr:hypothetical protein [Litchfieldia salsa]SDP50822.1 hypothetical protein SAMN05216565_103371 [Litchfieldia salsa]